ncbi:MAG: binding-protein-dependent transporter inner rane component [Blastococcus sp.]|nr:binding-protein-dependent transporter inner rane component [Blastococcus sp.]
MARIVSLAALLGAWQYLSGRDNIYFVPPVQDAASSLWNEVVNGNLLRPALQTGALALTGFLLALVIGTVVGVLIAVFRPVSYVLEPIMSASNATPIAVLIPIIGIYLGLGFSGKVAIVFLFCVFAVSMNTTSGIREIKSGILEMTRAYCVTGWRRYRDVIVPAAMPALMAGVRISAGRAVQGALTAELLLAVSGLGLYLMNAGNRYDVPDLVAGTVFVSAAAFLALHLAGRWEGHVLRWRTDLKN